MSDTRANAKRLFDRARSLPCTGRRYEEPVAAHESCRRPGSNLDPGRSCSDTKSAASSCPPGGTIIVHRRSSRLRSGRRQYGAHQDRRRRHRGPVAATGKPYYAPDVSVDPYYIEATSSVRSEFTVPLIIDGRTIGVLDVESSEPDDFPEDVQHVLEAFAAFAALAIYQRNTRKNWNSWPSPTASPAWPTTGPLGSAAPGAGPGAAI